MSFSSDRFRPHSGRAAFVSAKVAKAMVRAVSRAERASDFLLRQKVTKDHCAPHAGFGNVVLPQLPCASRAKRAGANSAIHGLEHPRLAPAWRCDARRLAKAREELGCDDGHPWPASMCIETSMFVKSAQGVRHRGLLGRDALQRRVDRLGDRLSVACMMVQGRPIGSDPRAGCAPNGAPRTRRVDDGNARRVARTTRASSLQAHGCAVSEPRRPRVNPEHMDVRRTCSRGGLLFGDFLLATQEKVTRPPGRRTEKRQGSRRSFAGGRSASTSGSQRNARAAQMNRAVR